jgi:hypothetical protein
MNQFEPETPEEVNAYETLARQQAQENAQNSKNGRFVFWLLVTLFGAAALSALLAS